MVTSHVTRVRAAQAAKGRAKQETHVKALGKEASTPADPPKPVTRARRIPSPVPKGKSATADLVTPTAKGKRKREATPDQEPPQKSRAKLPTMPVAQPDTIPTVNPAELSHPYRANRLRVTDVPGLLISTSLQTLL
jgi:hypothetical protein